MHIFPEDKEELALTLAGKKKKLNQVHFEQLSIGLVLSGKQIRGAFQCMINNKKNAISWIDRSFLSDDMKIEYKETLNQKYEQIELS